VSIISFAIRTTLHGVGWLVTNGRQFHGMPYNYMAYMVLLPKAVLVTRGPHFKT